MIVFLEILGTKLALNPEINFNIKYNNTVLISKISLYPYGMV